MRIIAGNFKGRKLCSPKGCRTRPTSDRVREAIFSIIGNRVEDSRVLDLYSGTGAMGLEALSRGAEHAVFVEKDPAAVQCIKVNIDRCGCPERTAIVNSQVLSFLGTARMWKGFKLVFADPPYEGDLGTLTLKAISKNAKPLKRCLIIVEHGPDNPPGHDPENFHLVDSRKYGNTGVTFFEFQSNTGRSA